MHARAWNDKGIPTTGLMVAACLLLPLGVAWGASDLDEFKVKREAVFDFARKPVLTRSGDRVTIAFETKGFCDVTVAIEDAGGKIVRHLASGVLGPKAPEPFQKNAKKQAIVWDGKDDQGKYIDEKDTLTVRVSLGLKALLDKRLFWSPYKRLHQGGGRWGFVGTQGCLPTPRIAAAPEGVYVFEGRGVDNLRLFDHDGKYVRTVYPPPADKLAQIVGLRWYPYPQEGNPLSTDHQGVTGNVEGRRDGSGPLRWFLGDREVLPFKRDILETTFLSSGPSGLVEKVPSMYGSAATALAVQGNRIALVHRSLNRLATDGSSGGFPLEGPKTCIEVIARADGVPETAWSASPTSAAFSPDGKTLYCTGHLFRQGRHSTRIVKDCLHGVLRLNYETNDPATTFVGSLKQSDTGTADGRFRDATSVDCDAQGRVYVTDFANDRIQVFAPDGKHLKNISFNKPAVIRINRKTQELCVFSWMIDNWATVGRDVEVGGKKPAAPAQLVILKSIDDPTPAATYPLPLLNYRPEYAVGKIWAGLEYTAEMDFATTPPRLWLVPGHPGSQDFIADINNPVTWAQSGIKVYALRDRGRLELVRDFGAEAAKMVERLEPPMFSRQRLVVNPKTGLLYVLEGQNANAKGVINFLEINPETGAIREIPGPFDFEDMTIDPQGAFLFRSQGMIARYELMGAGRAPVAASAEANRGAMDDFAVQSWREVPFDYGVPAERVGFSSSNDGRRARVLGGLLLYKNYLWHTGGIAVNVMGDILINVLLTKGDALPDMPFRTDEAHAAAESALVKYVPVLYPGRIRQGETHIYDPRGRLLHEDVAKGQTDIYGVGLDKDDNVYIMNAPNRILDGTPYFDPMASTLMKFKPGKGKIISENCHLIRAEVKDKPNRPHDLVKGGSPAWVDGAEWMYGGVGYSGHSAPMAAGHCSCWNARFTLDYFARSFVPELRRFNIAVLDTNGNLITRIGHYGNVDEDVSGSENIPLMHGAYVATQTDRRLFIADGGNARILAVKLDYHANERIPLKGVKGDAL